MYSTPFHGNAVVIFYNYYYINDAFIVKNKSQQLRKAEQNITSFGFFFFNIKLTYFHI